jgi:polar amino acid transport system ATP-binding protein
MIEVCGLTKRLGQAEILRDITFDVPSGSVAAVVGPSGGGKTTLLRCLHGLDPFEAGSVSICGAKLKAGAERGQKAALAGVRAKAGFVFQTWHLFAHMTVLENVVEAPIHVRKVPRAEARDRAEALLEKVGLSHRRDALPRALSGGEQQRAAIARALAMAPEVLFMDEPTSALDPQRVGSLVELLAGFRDDGLTLVVVTHDTGFALKLAERALVLVDGRLVEEGAPKDVLTSPTDERTRRFLGLA